MPSARTSTGSSRAGSGSVPAASNESVVRRIFDAFARKEGLALRGLFDEDAVWTVPGSGVMAGTYRGREEIFRFLARLPKETGGTYSSELVDVLVSEERAAALYRARGTRNGRTLELDQVLLFSFRDGVVSEVLALPGDPAAFEVFWA
jgi:ketosteroid isomerase-like protein